jgi:sporulation protein YlmC with PRC-barrel domain
MRYGILRPVLGLAALVCFSNGVLAQTKFEKVEYLKAAKEGEKKGEVVKGTLDFDATKKTIRLVTKDNTPAVEIPYESVKSMLYEKTAKPRYAAGILLAWPLLFTKSKKHYLTVQYTDASAAGQFVIFHLDKSNYQTILATAEAQTGKKVDRTEEH